jgi:glutamyl-tRNA reductase
MIIANRSFDKAWHLAQKFQGQALSITEIGSYLNQAEIIVSATTSQLPILGKGAVESALKLRKHRPMLMIDLAVPRDIEPEIAELQDVYLYNLDDLQSIIAENLKNRKIAAQQAEALIEIKVENFMRDLRGLEAVDTIQAYRKKIEKISEEKLTEAITELKQGKNAETILRTMMHNLIQKIMHEPTLQLRRAAAEGQLNLLLLAKRLFDI